MPKKKYDPTRRPVWIPKPKKKHKKVVLVEFDETDAIYVDGKLKVEDGPLSPASVLAAVGIDFDQISGEYNDEGEIPENLSDLKE